MIIYYLTWIYLFSMTCFEIKGRSYFKNNCRILLIFFSFSLTVGWDWISYEDAFYNPVYLEEFEILNIFIFKFVKKIGNYELIPLVYNFLFLIILENLLYKKIKYPTLGLLCYYSTYFLRLNLSTFRQGIACMLFLYGMFIVEKRKSFIFYTLGMLFHRTAIFMFLLLPILKYKLKKINMVIILLISLVVPLLKISLIQEFLKLMLSVTKILSLDILTHKIKIYSVFSSDFNNVSIIKILLLLYFFFYLYKIRIDENNQVNINMIFLFFLIMFLTYDIPVIFLRIRYYFFYSWIFISIDLLEKISKNLKKYYILMMFIIIFIRFSYNFLDSKERRVYFPYKNLIFEFILNNDIERIKQEKRKIIKSL